MLLVCSSLLHATTSTKCAYIMLHNVLVSHLLDYLAACQL